MTIKDETNFGSKQNNKLSRALEQEYWERAYQKWHDEGEVEIDDNAKVSLAMDENGVVGAYVQAWVWVAAPEKPDDE